MLAFYDSHLKNLTGLRRSGETPTLQERAAQPGSGESTAPLLAQLADDVELLTAWQTEQNILHLSEEQLAQRRRVIEEEARALLARQPVITSSSSLSAQPVTSTPTLVQPNPSPKSFSLMSSAPASARKPLSAIPVRHNQRRVYFLSLECYTCRSAMKKLRKKGKQLFRHHICPLQRNASSALCVVGESVMLDAVGDSILLLSQNLSLTASLDTISEIAAQTALTHLLR